jgi:hypothetical protein
MAGASKEITSADVKVMLEASGVSSGRIGAILTLLASAGVGACAFLKINEK